MGHFSSILLLFVLLSIVMVSPVANNQRDEISAVSEAGQAMAEAYEAVLDAEKVGADVSDLLFRLNDGAGLLSEARMLLSIDDFEEALRFAVLATEIAWEVMDDAEGLEVEASHTRVSEMWWSVVGSVLGVSFVLIVSLLGYRTFKRRYYRRLLKMRPKVGQT